MADIIARVLNRPGTVLDVVLHIANAFESFTFLDKRKSYRISDRVFGLVSSFFSIFCYLSYIDMFVLSYTFLLYRYVCVNENVPAMTYTRTRKVASDIIIYGNYFLQYF